MPTVLRVGPYRFFFYAGDRDELPHIHFERDAGEAKFWLEPILLEHSHGFGSKEINRIPRLVEDHHQELLESWYAFFSNWDSNGERSRGGDHER